MKIEQKQPNNQPNQPNKSVQPVQPRFRLPAPGRTATVPVPVRRLKRRRAPPEPWGGALMNCRLGESTPEATRFHNEVLRQALKPRVRAVVVERFPVQPQQPAPMNEAPQPPRDYAKEARDALAGLGEFRLLKGGKPRRGFARVALLVGVAFLALWVLLGIIPSLKVPSISLP